MALSFWQLLIILFLVIIFFGSKRLPLLGQSLKDFVIAFKKGKEGSGDIDITVSARPVLDEDKEN